MSGVEIRVRSNSTQARQDLGKLQKSVGNIEKSTKRLQSAFNKIAIGGAAFLSLASFTKGITRASDSITNMENKIALVTGRGRELNSTMQSLARVSSQTRVSFSTTAETFNRFGLALRGSGTSAKELLDVTRTINQAVTISGASSESARAAIVQFGQGLASGQLRGQELNSVLEQTPRIARAIADGIGIPFGQLRDAAAEGKLTTEAVLKAIQKAAPEIATEFLLIKKTVDSVSNAFRFQLQRSLSVLATETGWSEMIIDKLEKITKGLKFFADNASFYFYLVRFEVELAAATLRKFLDPLKNIFTVEFKPKEAAANLKTNFDKFLEQARGIITFKDFYDENTKQFDFSAFFGQFELPSSIEENFNKTAKAIDTFIVNIKRLYNALFGKNVVEKVPGFQEKIIPVSLNTEVLEEDVNLFQKFLDKLTEFSGEAIGRILNLTETLRPLFESIGSSIEAVSSTIKTTINGLGGYDGILEKNSTALKTYYERLKDIIGLDVKAKNLKESMLNLIPEDNTDLTKRIREQSKKIQDAVLGEEVLVNPMYNEQGRTTRVGGSLEKGFKFLDENRGLLAAAGVAGGLAIVFPETTAAALQLAAIGAGLAFVSLIQGVFSKGLPIILTFGGYQLLVKGIADDPDYKEEVKDFTKGITEGLMNAFVGADKSTAASVVNDIGVFLEAVGEGIIDGLFGDKFDFENKFVDGFVGAITIAGLLAIPRMATIASFGLLAGAMGKAIFSNKGGFLVAEMIAGITLGLIDVNESAKSGRIAAQAKDFGKFFFRSAFSILSIDYFGDLLKKQLENIQVSIGVDENEVDKGLTGTMNDIAVGFAKGVAAALALKVKHPVAVLAAGFAGSFLEVVGGSEFVDRFKRLGVAMYEGFTENLPSWMGGQKQSLSLPDNVGTTGKPIIDMLSESDSYEGKGSEIDLAIQRRFNLLNQLGKTNKEIAEANKALEEATDLYSQAQQSRVLDRLRLQQNVLNIQIAKLDSKINSLNKRGTFTGNFNDLQGAIPPKLSSGGMITGAGGPKDDKIPHMLSNGEYVIQASAVKKFGPSFMDALNKGQVPQFKNNGGLAGDAIFGGLSASSLSLIQFMSGEEAAKLKAIAGINFTGKDYFEKVMGDKDSDVLNYLNEHAPDLSPALTINVKDEDSLKELIELVNKETGTNPSNINAIQEHLIRRGTLKSTKDAYNSPDGFYKGLSVLANQLGIEFPEYDNLRTIPKALMTTANLASAAIGGGGRWKSDQYRPLVRGWEKGLYGPEGDNITGFGPELRKAFFNGLPLAPEGAAYGATFGALKGLSSTILGTFKGIGNIVLGTINRDPKKLLSGALGFGSSVVRTGLGISSIPVQAALYGLLGGTMYTAMGGLDYLLSGNRTYMGNAIDLNMFKKKATRDDRDHPMLAPSNYSTMRSGLNFTDFDSFKNKFSKIDLSFLNKEQKRQAAIDVSGYDLNYLLRHYNLVRESFQRPSGREKVGLNSTSIDNTWQGKVIPKYYETLDHPFLDIQTKEPKLTDSLDEFLQAYNVGLHEYGHVNQFLNMAKENLGHGKTDFDYISTWPSRINRTVLEADANSFLKQTSLADIEDTLKVLRASQTSYMANAMATGTLTPKALKDSLEVTELKEFEEFYEAFLEGNKTIGGNSQRAMIKFFYNKLGIKDRMRASFEANKFASGGYVTGEGGPTDDKIPAMLSNKEFVVNAKQTSKFRPILEAINSGMVAGFKGGMLTGSSEVTPFTVTSSEPEVKGIKGLQKRFNDLSSEILMLNSRLDIVKSNIGRADGNMKLLNMSFSAAIPLQAKLDAATSERAEVEKLLEQAAKGAAKAVDETAKAIKGLTLSAREMALGETFAKGIRDDFQTGFREALNTGDFMQIDLLDSFTKNWLNSFSEGFTDSLFGTMEKDKDGKYTSTGMMGQLQQLGGGAANFGGKASPMAKQGEELTSPLFGEGGLFGGMINSIKTGLGTILSGTGEGGGLGTLISKIGPFFSGLGESLTQGLTKLFNPQGGGGSGGMGMPMMTGNPWLDLGMMALPFLFNNGGIVPSTPYSKAGVDSVPAMLTPGELVVPANKVKSYQDNTNKQQNIVNLSISGDVSRQTRQEIIKMLPTISAGVNATNKENNYKGR